MNKLLEVGHIAAMLGSSASLEKKLELLDGQILQYDSLVTILKIKREEVLELLKSNSRE
jgi:hypothetical protein